MEILRQCKCGTIATTQEELELFTKYKKLKYGRRNTCKVCTAKMTRKSLGFTTEAYKLPKGTYTTVKGQSIWARYGLSEDEYKAMLEAVGYKCEICNLEKDLNVDHCHSTGKVRGLLCTSCNTSIGKLGDTAESVMKAVNYLNKEV